MLKRTQIKKKKCKCQECTDNPDKAKFPTMSCEGYAYSHMPDDVKERVGTKTKVRIKNRNKKVALTAKLHKAQRELNGDSILELWFLERMNTCVPMCDNCKTIKENIIDGLHAKQWRSCQAHLLPKRHFKSIMTHPLNGMVLGTGYSGMCNCHDTYDSSWQAASQMGIWKEVVRRFKLMYPMIAENEHQFIPQLLINEL